MLDKSDWISMKETKRSRVVRFRCLRSQTCFDLGWLTQTHASRHRENECSCLDPSFVAPHIPGAQRLNVVVARGEKRDRAGTFRDTGRSACNDTAADQLTVPPERVYEEIDPFGGFQGQGEVRGQPGESLSVDLDCTVPPGLVDPQLSDQGTDAEPHYLHDLPDDARYSYQPEDGWDPGSPASDSSGASFDLAEADPADDEEPAGLHSEPQYSVLQARLVSHMRKHGLAAREARSLNRTTGWAQAAGKRVSNQVHAVSVRQYVYNHLSMFRNNVQSRFCAEEHLLSNAYGLMERAPSPDPTGVENCYPPTVACAMGVLDVPELEIYEVHMCGKGCVHWWFHMPNQRHHFNTCSAKGGCPECMCPHCGTCRFVKDKKGIHGAERVWFFWDCIHTKALDPEWSSIVLNTQALREKQDSSTTKPSFTKYAEYKRVLQQLPAGTRPENVRSSEPLCALVIWMARVQTRISVVCRFFLVMCSQTPASSSSGTQCMSTCGDSKMLHLKLLPQQGTLYPF